MINRRDNIPGNQEIMQNELLMNIGKVHTTEMGAERIRKNLGLGNIDVEKWCIDKIGDELSSIDKVGKNWYVYNGDVVITVNASSYTIITAHKNAGKKEKKADRTERAEFTVLCLIQYGNRILLQNRVKNDWKGYTLPGGHVEPGESFVDAVIREMKEETGLDIINPELAGIKQFPIKGGRYIVLLFKAEHFRGEVVSSDEGEMEWVEYDRLSEVNTVDDLQDLLKVINSAELTEFRYVVNGDDWKVFLR